MSQLKRFQDAGLKGSSFGQQNEDSNENLRISQFTVRIFLAMTYISEDSRNMNSHLLPSTMHVSLQKARVMHRYCEGSLSGDLRFFGNDAESSDNVIHSHGYFLGQTKEDARVLSSFPCPTQQQLQSQRLFIHDLPQYSSHNVLLLIF